MFPVRPHPCGARSSIVPRNPEVTGALIAGGRSRRMGRDKRLLVLDGLTLLDRALFLLEEACGEVFVVAPEPFPVELRVPRVPDRIPGMGVLGGIHAALIGASFSEVLCVAVDTPLLTAQWLDLLVGRCLKTGRPCAPFVNGRVHPLPACYPKSARPFVESALRSGDATAHHLLSALNADLVDEEQAEAGGCDPRSLTNVNNQEEWHALLTDEP